MYVPWTLPVSIPWWMHFQRWKVNVVSFPRSSSSLFKLPTECRAIAHIRIKKRVILDTALYWIRGKPKLPLLNIHAVLYYVRKKQSAVPFSFIILNHETDQISRLMDYELVRMQKRFV